MLTIQENMGFNRNEYIPNEYLFDEDIDHLPYLKKHPSIFEDEDDGKMGKRILTCADCGHPVTTVSQKIEVRGRHDHAFRYYDDVVQLGCFRNAQGCVGVQRISNGYSWFRGYGWQVQVCGNCHTQLGWKYISEEDSFYGLIFKMLREVDPEEDNGAMS